MPGLHVHLAIGALVGAALLPRFDRRALAVVLAAAALPDLDTLLGFWIVGGHRTILHTLVVPAVLTVGLVVDDRLAGSARLRRRAGARGVGLAWAGVAAMTVGGIAPDLVTNGVNALWPFVDTFYTVDGRLLVTDQRGIVQSFVEFPAETGGGEPRTTENTQFQTGVDPSPEPEEEADPDPERIFWLFTAGWQVAFTAAAAVVVPARLRSER